MRVIQIIFISLFGALLLLPGIQMYYEPFPVVRLANARIPKLPRTKSATFLSGRWQQDFERWLVRANKLWGALLRTDSQINFSLFSQISNRYGSAILLGQDNYLYQWLYLRDMNFNASKKEESFRKKVLRIKELQERLREAGKAFVILVSQNKLSSAPEIVPSWYRSKNFNNPNRRMHVMKKLFDEYGIEYIDSGKLFASSDLISPHGFYNKGGSHWTQPGACLVAYELIKRLQAQLKRPLPSFSCGQKVEMKSIPDQVDRDLSRVVNIWTESKTYGTTPYVEILQEEHTDVFRPNVLIVGTSFIWSIRKILDRVNFYSRNDFYFYNKTNYSTRVRGGRRQGHKRSLIGKPINWAEIDASNAIVLEASDALISSVGFRFVGQYLKRQAFNRPPQQ